MRLIPEITEPTVEAILEALLKHYTCGTLVTILAGIQEKAKANQPCAKTLLSIIEFRRAEIYVQNEQPRNPSSHSATQTSVRMTLTSEVAKPPRRKRTAKRDEKGNSPIAFEGADITVL